jgi:hypothetical protein
MLYRYRMHLFADPRTPPGVGRPLFGRNAAEAIAQAGTLWEEETSTWALGYRVIDTEDGAVLWQRQRTRLNRPPA